MHDFRRSSGEENINHGGAALAFENCSITGTGGQRFVDGLGRQWNNWMSFDNCTISGTLNLFVGVFNVTDSTLSGSPHVY